MQVEGMPSGRGLLPGLRAMHRVLFDPAFEADGSEAAALLLAKEEAARELQEVGHVALQWHSQNALSTTVSDQQLALMRRLFRCCL